MPYNIPRFPLSGNGAIRSDDRHPDLREHLVAEAGAVGVKCCVHDLAAVGADEDVLPEVTNGTFLDGARIETPHPLVDGKTVTFGSEEALFREWSDTAAPATEPVHSRAKRTRG